MYNFFNPSTAAYVFVMSVLFCMYRRIFLVLSATASGKLIAENRHISIHLVFISLLS